MAGKPDGKRLGEVLHQGPLDVELGYHYQQVTGDSGAGARLGGFEGRVTGLGPDVTYMFLCGKIPVSTEVKYFHEFDVENRLQGDAGLVTVSLPLSVGH